MSMAESEFEGCASGRAINRVAVSDIASLCVAAERCYDEILVRDECVKFVRGLRLKKSAFFDDVTARDVHGIDDDGIVESVGAAMFGAAGLVARGFTGAIGALPLLMFGRRSEKECKNLLKQYCVFIDNGFEILLRLRNRDVRLSSVHLDGVGNQNTEKVDENFEQAEVGNIARTENEQDDSVKEEKSLLPSVHLNGVSNQNVETVDGKLDQAEDENVAQAENVQDDSVNEKENQLPDIGDIVGAHRIIKMISRGGMAVVFEVEHVGLQMRRAMKFFDPRCENINDIKRLAERFNNEARLLNEASQRVGDDVGLTRVYDFQPDPLFTPPYYVMDLILGPNGRPCSLWQAKNDGLLTVETLNNWFVDICSTLGVLHRNHIIHRDIKPENILLDKDGHAVIVDLGAARDVAKSDGSEDRFSIVTPFVQEQIGTRRYWAPELENGKDATVESDVYAVGATFYELIFGECFSIDQYPLKIDSFLDMFDEEVEVAVMWHERLLRMLSPNPQDRPHTADECVKCEKPAKRFRFTWRWMVIAGAGALAMIVASALSFVWLRTVSGGGCENRILRYESDDGKIEVKYINNARLVVDQYYTDFVVIENGIRKRYECPMTDCGSCGNCTYRSDDGEFTFEDLSWGGSPDEKEIPIYVTLGMGESARKIHLNQIEGDCDESE